MDYEKEYKEAFERAKNLHKDAIDMGENIRAKQCEIIFPELAESEDEKMREELIRSFKSLNTIEIWNGIKRSDILAWLEKQQGGKDKFTQQHSLKEDSNVNDETNAPTEYGKYVDECLNEASKHFFSEGEDKYSVADLFYAGVRCGQSWLEKQGEQKSYGQRQECIDCQFNYAGECKGSCQMKRSERKPADKVELAKSESEEELSDFEAALFSAFSDGWQQYLNGEEVDMAQWAKEHSTELLEAAKQNHVAWSEEDEQIVLSIEQVMACASLLNIVPEKIDKIRTWLKSLKERIGG